MQRRNVLQLAGASFVTAAGAGCLTTGGGNRRQGGELIEFDNPGELLLTPELLPGDGWEEQERGDADVLDVEVTFLREFEEGEQVDGEEGNNWLVVSAVAGHDDEAAARNRYEELVTGFTDTVGEARTMDLDLASDAVIAGYDGFASALFRDVNCVAAVSFTDCVALSGLCTSDVARVEGLARTQRESWRGSSQDGGDQGSGNGDDGGDGGDGDDGGDSDDGDQTGGGGQTFEGEGTQATESFQLEEGFLAVSYEHQGSENFAVTLVDTAGEDPEYLLANGIGSVSGRTAEGIDGGEYVIDVQADGAWRIELTQPRPSEADARELPATVEGEGSDYAGPLLFDGLVRATASHDGESNFIVEALDENGDWGGGLVFNETGSFEGESTFTQNGLGWLTADADGQWTIDLEHG